jgi:HEAT repeat protein
MQRGGKTPPPSEVSDFLQEVAEATGLLSIHTGSSGSSPEDLITFMHFSFLEYYTAAGFIACGYDQVLSRLSKNPRWKDVTTLLFGVLSDYRDVTPDLKTLLMDDTPAGRITEYKLLLGMDCASECDVPPEGAQDLLANALTQSIETGAARYSAELRQEIASRLEYFLTGVGRRLEEAIVEGIASKDPITSACFCHLVATLDSNLPLSAKLQRAFAEAIRVDHPVVRAAAMLAIEEHPDLRNTETERVVGIALKGNLSEKHSALKVLCSIPDYHLTNEARVRDLLNDPNPLIAELAANSLLINRLRYGTWNGQDLDTDKALKEKVLAHLSQSDQDMPLSVSGVTLDYGAIEGMLASGDHVTKELAIRYISVIKNDASYVHRTLSRVLRNAENGRLRAACMDSFRAAPEALTLFSIADTDLVCSLVDEKEKNVRIAALRLLGELPDDEQVVGSLKRVLRNKQNVKDRKSEVSEAAKALAKHVKRNPKLRGETLSVIVAYLPTPDRGFGNAEHQDLIRSLLYVCETISGTDEKAAQKLLTLAEDYRTPERIRRQALRAFGRIAEPNASNVHKLRGLLDKNDPRLREAVYPAVSAFIMRSRARVEYVRRIYQSLSSLRTSLERAWVRETSLVRDSIDPSGPRDIRAAVLEIENLTAAYEEFSERATSGGIAG